MPLFDRFNAFQSKPAFTVREIPGFLDKGKAALERSDSVDATKAFAAVLVIDPENPEGWSGLGNAYAEAGESERAIEAFKKAVAHDGENSEYFLQLGREQLAANLNEEAQNNLMQGLLLAGDAGSADDWYNLALCLYHQSKPGEAVPFCRRVLEREHSPDADAQQLLANCLFDLDAYDEAVELYQTLLRDQPENHDMLVNLGLALEILGRQEEAIPILEKAITRDDQNRDLYASLSRGYAAVGKDDESQAAAQKYNELAGT